MEFDFEEQLDVQPEVVAPAGDQVRALRCTANTYSSDIGDSGTWLLHS